VRLVHSAEVAYTETGNLSTDLGRLRSTTDGYIDNVHTLRNTYKADLVSLFVANGGSYCGMAYVMTSVSTSFATNGFSVVDKDCATGYYSFGHEMGHNMGARHDRYVDGTDGSPYKYNHGHYYAAGKWRTVMAYNDGCSAAGTSCTRVPYWSNPNKFYNGVATGVSSTSTGAADNRLTLNNTAYTVANFRASQ
jgi:peptidyl-Asp metalloendopeptidase